MKVESIPQAWQPLVLQQFQQPLLADNLLQPVGCLGPADLVTGRNEYWVL